jgi:hypothetical protein
VVGGKRHAPAALLPEKTRYALIEMLVGSQDRCGRIQKIPPASGFFFLIFHDLQRIRSPDREARSESLYRLSCPGPLSLASSTEKFGELYLFSVGSLI